MTGTVPLRQGRRKDRRPESPPHQVLGVDDDADVRLTGKGIGVALRRHPR
jgi:hypothetical protein